MGPGPGVADDVAVMERGAAENEGCRIRAGPIQGFLSGFSSATKIQSVIALAFYDHVPGSSRETGAEVSGRGV